MALNIEKATIGYDVAGIQALYGKLKEQCVDNAIKNLKDNIAALEADLDEAWVGASADQFKKNMEYDRDVISQALSDALEIFHTEMSQIVSAMQQVDQELVKGRE